jgi:hypothetical protein
MGMRELVTQEQAQHAFILLAVAAPIIGLAIGALRKSIVAGLAWGLLIGPGNLVLWFVYNSITDRLGLDTVKNLLVNLGLFVALGLMGGFIYGRATRGSALAQAASQPETPPAKQ